MLVGAVLLLAGCGSASGGPGTAGVGGPATATTTAAAVPSAPPSTKPAASKPPHFDTPEAAMRYLTSAWNRNDIVELKHVTDPSARVQLNAMHSEATNLKLTSCTKRPQGDYDCIFSHDFPAGYQHPKKSVGEAEFIVGPADTPGWYMTVFQHCG